MRRFLAVFVLLCGLAAPAEAVTLRDLIDLSKQGLSDDLLIALVEAEKSVFHLDAADVKVLKEQGLSDRLVIHLLQTREARRAEAEAALAAPAPAAPRVERAVAAPQVVVIDRVETVAVPVYVAVPVQTRDAGREHAGDRGHDRNDDRDKPASPVYWGYGGKLRPGSWKPGGGRDNH